MTGTPFLNPLPPALESFPGQADFVYRAMSQSVGALEGLGTIRDSTTVC